MARDEVRPGRGGPPVVKTMIHLTERQKEALRQHAIRTGTTMSGAVRQMVNDLLLADDEDE